MENGRGQLSFAKNDIDMGVAYSDLPSPLYPFISIYYADTQCSFVD